jgi:hypothetical protein
MSDVENMLQAKRDYILKLKDAIRNLHGCESEYAGTRDVIETFQGETVWSGNVEIFNIRGHPKAKRCYAWSHAAGKNDRETRYVAVLELPPVDSPETAVKVAVAAEIKNEREKAKGR